MLSGGQPLIPPQFLPVDENTENLYCFVSHERKHFLPEPCPLEEEVEVVRHVDEGEGEEEKVVVIAVADTEPGPNRRN